MGFFDSLLDFGAKQVLNSSKVSPIVEKRQSQYDNYYRSLKNESKENLKKIAQNTSNDRLKRQAAYDLYNGK